MKILIKFPTYSLCRSHFRRVIWIWVRRCFLCSKSMNDYFFKWPIFYVLYRISFNFWTKKSYYTPKFWKFYEDSTELYKIEIVALVVKIFWFYLVHFLYKIIANQICIKSGHDETEISLQPMQATLNSLIKVPQLQNSYFKQ